jgi:polar amino acid transport system substrate-binding protein
VARTYGPILLRAAGMTVLLTVVSMPLAMLLGLVVALLRMYGPAAARWTCAVYVEILRGTPVMLQLYVIFFILPQLLPFSFSPVTAAIIGLAINYSAYEAEIYRAGLQAIPHGQMEAALALGLTRRMALRRVIVPQAVRIVVPPVTNDFIAMFKDTSVCSVIAVTELTKQYNMLANSTGEVLKLAALTAGLYLAMSYPLSVVARRLERKLASAGFGATAAATGTA